MSNINTFKMTILQISGKDNLVNLQNDPKLYYIIIIGALLSTISFALTQNLLTVVLLIFTTIYIFFTLNQAPKEIIINLNDDSLDIGGNHISWSNIDSWLAVSENQWLEVVIKSTNLTKPFLTFYILGHHPRTQQFLVLLSERASYDETTLSENLIRSILKKLGLR